MHFFKKYSNIIRLAKALYAEMSEWFKEHDWKSCVGQKLTGGSNPLLCANKKHTILVCFLLRKEELANQRISGGSRERSPNRPLDFSFHFSAERHFVAISNNISSLRHVYLFLWRLTNKEEDLRDELPVKKSIENAF